MKITDVIDLLNEIMRDVGSDAEVRVWSGKPDEKDIGVYHVAASFNAKTKKHYATIVFDLK
jgi:hypothetical protein